MKNRVLTLRSAHGSTCRKSLFSPLNKFSELYKSSENLGFQWRRTPFLGFHAHPSFPSRRIYHFIDSLTVLFVYSEADFKPPYAGSECYYCEPCGRETVKEITTCL